MAETIGNKGIFVPSVPGANKDMNIFMQVRNELQSERIMVLVI